MTTIYTFPAIEPTTTSIELVTNTKMFISPLTGYTQSTSRQGTRWRLQQTFANLQEAERQSMIAFLTRLNGQLHRAAIYDHSYKGSRETPGGTVTLSATASAGDTSISTTGWTTGTDVLAPGDLIHVINDNSYTELKRVVNTSTVTSDGSGNATINIVPEIHSTCTSGNSVIYTDPVGVFLLAENASWTNRPGQYQGSSSPFSSFSLTWFEDIT